MAPQIVPECRCMECNQLMDVARQDDGKGSFYWLVTYWNPDCGLRTVTRSLDTYNRLTEAELESYREMNRMRDEVSA